MTEFPLFNVFFFFFKKDIHLTLVGMKVGASSSGVLWMVIWQSHCQTCCSLQCMVISLFVCMIFRGLIDTHIYEDFKWQKESSTSSKHWLRKELSNAIDSLVFSYVNYGIVYLDGN